jgi:Ca2+-binding EF-hand superfamily protein
MNKVLGLLFSLSVLAGGTIVASAQDHPPPPPPGFGGGGQRMMQFPTFADLDKNKDKKISKDEMPSQLPPQMFDRMDSNRDGSVDEEEWKAMMAQFSGGGGGRPGERMMIQGPRPTESLSKLLDGDSDTKISREEFGKIVTLFDKLDKDHNSELSTEEMNAFFRVVNEASNEATGGVEVSSLFEKNDKNKDGKITADEMGNERAFKGLDINKDGEVTRTEADTALKQLKKASEAKKTAQPNY